MIGMASFVRRFVKWFGLAGQNTAVTCAQSQFECLCGVLGRIGETGMYIAIDLLRGELAAPSVDAVHGALSRGPQSPGQRQRTSVSVTAATSKEARRHDDTMQGAIGGLLKYYERRAA